MDDQDKVEPDYVKGFNEGYILAKHMPELAERLADIDSDFVRLAGFKAGREQQQTEMARERLPAWLTGDRPQKAEKSPIKTKDRDKEPDKD
ncbi:hypothetical protein [uncultured Fibrella sp.]|uniref:hypothetical protein n=1 Tax=uncultured Fibrella sp. TaxID=1284596 RepID=UPI0035CA7FC4